MATSRMKLVRMRSETYIRGSRGVALGVGGGGDGAGASNCGWGWVCGSSVRKGETSVPLRLATMRVDCRGLQR